MSGCTHTLPHTDFAGNDVTREYGDVMEDT